MMLIRKTSNREEKEREEAAQQQQYQAIVEEIRSEGRIMGSLQLHNEAMIRLKELNGGETLDESIKSTGSKGRPRRVLARGGFARSTMAMADFTKSLRVDGLAKSITIAMARGSDPDLAEAEVIPGRRESTQVVGFDHQQMLQDLELSDSEDEDEGGALDRICREGGVLREESNLSQQSVGSKGRGSSRRSSIIRRSSSLLGRTRRRFSRKSSNVSSVSYGSGSTPPSTEPRDKRTSISEEEPTGDNEGRRIFDSGETEKDTSSEGEGGGIGGAHNNHENKAPPPGTSRRRNSVTKRTMDQRSSLFSVDERKASITINDLESLDRLRASGNSLGESLQGSFSGGDGRDSYVARDGSLICGFGRKGSIYSSFGSAGDGGGGNEFDDSLICDWERRQSSLSMQDDPPREADHQSIQDNMPREGGDASSGGSGNRDTLICGWDPRLSQMSLHEDKSARWRAGGASDRTLLCDWKPVRNTLLTGVAASLDQELDRPAMPSQTKEEVDVSERALRQAKEACSLFDVRNK